MYRALVNIGSVILAGCSFGILFIVGCRNDNNMASTPSGSVKMLPSDCLITNDKITALTAARNANVFAIGEYTGVVTLCVTQPYIKRIGMFQQSKQIWAMSLDPSGKLVAVSFLSQPTVLLLNTETAKVETQFQHVGGIGVQAIAFSNDGVFVATGTGSAGGTVDLYDVRNGTSRNIFNQRTNVFVDRHTKNNVWRSDFVEICDLAFSPDSKTIAIALETGVVLINVTTGKEIAFLKGSQLVSTSFVVYSPSEHRILMGGADSITVWDTKSHNEIASLNCGNNGPVTKVAVSYDGRLVAASTGSEVKSRSRILVWRLDTGEEVHRIDCHDEPITSIAFVNKSYELLSASLDSHVCRWSVPFDINEAK